MRVSQLFGETFREAPATATQRSQQLLLRAGYMRELGAGTTALIPMGWRTLEQMHTLIRSTFTDMSAQAVRLPLLQPQTIWEQSGLLSASPLSTTSHCLAKTAYPAAAVLAADIRSYRQLPQLWQTLQTQFKDQNTQQGGWMNAPETMAHHIFAFERNAMESAKRFAAIAAAYHDILTHFQLTVRSVTAESGRYGDISVRKLVFPISSGSETIAYCENCGEGAMHDVAQFQKTPFSNPSPEPLQKIATPDASSIATLCRFLDIEPKMTAKIVFLMATLPDVKDEVLFICVVRGDMDISEAQVRQVTHALALRPAQIEEIEVAGCCPGYASPIGIRRENARVMVDDLIPGSPNLVTGANEHGFHLLNSNYKRDYSADHIAPIALAPQESNCAACGHPLTFAHGESIAEMRNFDTYYSERFSTAYLSEDGKPQPLYMSGFALNLHKTLACIAEAHHDDYGLIMPAAVAPYDIALLQLKGETIAAEAADLYTELGAAGYSVLWDDRKVSPGVQFNDADLRGLPLRITVSERALAQGGVEVKWRSDKERHIVQMTEILDFIRQSGRL